MSTASNIRQYRIEFLVKASSWGEVVNIFKEELGITNYKRDASDRDMNGAFLVHVYIADDQLNRDFYRKVTQSKRIAISYDPKGKVIRDEIMSNVCVVEHHLRKLLLNISDVVEDYFKYFDKTYAKDFAKSGDLIKEDDLNPITSYLTLDDAITIFSLDLSSWSGKPITAENLTELLNSGDSVDEIKKALQSKMTSNTVWDQVDKYILKKGTRWNDLRTDLNKLKNIRNKAAHFRIVTQSDLIEAKKLSKSVSNKVKKESRTEKSDIQSLRAIISSQMGLTNDIVQKLTAQMLPTTAIQKTINEMMKPIGLMQAAQAVSTTSMLQKIFEESLKPPLLSNHDSQSSSDQDREGST